MKTTAINYKRAKGVTLLELTVVILVLLTLISVLFIGARAWKKGSDRSTNILNVRNVQQAVRGYANMNNIPEGGDVAEATIFPEFLTRPNPPVAELDDYTYGTTNPAPAELYVQNPDLGKEVGEYWYSQAELDAGKLDSW